MSRINRPRGTVDILPGEVEKWQYIEDIARKLCRNFHYQEIRTPIFEHTDLFERGVGDETDIVQKEMYTFSDRGNRSLTLRPEGTAAVVRAYVENKIFADGLTTTKLFYMGPMFRYERAQAGRQRQFVQFGVEALGSVDPAIDAEVIALAMSFYQSLGLKNIRLVLNSLGDAQSRLDYRQALIRHFDPVIESYCLDCQKRLQTNPLRILDCKVDREKPEMKTAPNIQAYYSKEAKIYFETVLQYLDALGVTYTIDQNLVRGLDYYNHTAFEIMLDGEGFGAITTLCGGGRYNLLVEELGGPRTPGIGFALSIERAIMALNAEHIALPIEMILDCYVISMGEAARIKSLKIVSDLRKKGFSCELDYIGRKMKTLFKEAERAQAQFVLILGDNELKRGTIQVKHMATALQKEIHLEQLTQYLQQMR